MTGDTNAVSPVCNPQHNLLSWECMQTALSVYVGAFKASLSVTPALDAGGWMSQRGKGREEKWQNYESKKKKSENVQRGLKSVNMLGLLMTSGPWSSDVRKHKMKQKCLRSLKEAFFFLNLNTLVFIDMIENHC